MGNCWLIQPWAVGLGIWHRPSHGADPLALATSVWLAWIPTAQGPVMATAGGWGETQLQPCLTGRDGWVAGDVPGAPFTSPRGLQKSRGQFQAGMPRWWG